MNTGGNVMFKKLREQYQQFIYDSYEVLENDTEFLVTYTYLLNELTFHPNIKILKKDIINQKINSEYLNYLFFQYGLFDLMNYYKLTCSKEIVIRPMFLDENQIYFFKKVLYHGLGEYFYNNNINLSFDEFVSFKIEGTKKFDITTIDDSYSGNLIPVGGGKDSIVTLELLKEYKKDNKTFMFERNLYPKNKAGYDSIKVAGYDDTDITIFECNLDLQILELNKKGYLNGHIPFSACLSMASLIMAYLTNKKYIVLSNEASANEGNFEGKNINHQYSKSYEYEKDFREYCFWYLNQDIYYFSLLRPWNEYKIVQEFLKHKEYLSVFRSCNRGTKENIWCNHCSKCLYVYIMLYPYLSKEELFTVFDHDLLDDITLEKDFLGLVEEDNMKPFECVGTKLEINYSLQKALQFKKNNLPYLLNLYKSINHSSLTDDEVKNYFNPEHFVPDCYLVLLGEENEK